MRLTFWGRFFQSEGRNDMYFLLKIVSYLVFDTLYFGTRKISYKHLCVIEIPWHLPSFHVLCHTVSQYGNSFIFITVGNSLILYFFFLFFHHLFYERSLEVFKRYFHFLDLLSDWIYCQELKYSYVYSSFILCDDLVWYFVLEV